MTITVDAIPAFTDNYIWALSTAGRCMLVDPGDAGPALDYLEDRGLGLAGILLTHHHADHTGGVEQILDAHPAPCWGPEDPRMPAAARTVREGDVVECESWSFTVIETPGHTRSHIAFHGADLLFCGDTLFSAGCGRLFEGTPEQMQRSLDKLGRLPDETRVFCAHEYTEANCRFALTVEPGNLALRTRVECVRKLRAEGRITLPSTMGEERSFNPFLRTRKSDVIEAARRREPAADTTPGAVFGVIRRWKDAA